MGNYYLCFDIVNLFNVFWIFYKVYYMWNFKISLSPTIKSGLIASLFCFYWFQSHISFSQLHSWIVIDLKVWNIYSWKMFKKGKVYIEHKYFDWLNLLLINFHVFPFIIYEQHYCVVIETYYDICYIHLCQ